MDLERVLLIDNNDSFTYNVVGLLRKQANIFYDVVLASELQEEALDQYDRIIISPGPGAHTDFPVLEKVITHCLRTMTPLLGICLGHQAICAYFGGQLVQLGSVVHGQQVSVDITSGGQLYRDIPQRIQVGLYHSWAIDYGTMPDCLEVTGRTTQGTVMSVQHRFYNIHGIQYHPESFLTPQGKEILNNFLKVDVCAEMSL